MNVFTSPAKVNLTLDVLGKDAPDYHRIQTVYHEVASCADEITIELLNEPRIVLECDNPLVPGDASNTMFKAAEILQQTYRPTQGARLILKKNIPLSSGLGGGSSNAATVLKALNELWHLNLSRPTLLTYAAQIGMDVPFFILGGCAIGMHYGEQLMPLPPLKGHTIELLFTDIPVSTSEAYAGLNLAQCGQKNRDTGALAEILKGEKEGPVEALLHNDFEAPFFVEHPEVREKYPDAHLSGTGGTLFRIHAAPPATASM